MPNLLYQLQIWIFEKKYNQLETHHLFDLLLIFHPLLQVPHLPQGPISSPIQERPSLHWVSMVHLFSPSPHGSPFTSQQGFEVKLKSAKLWTHLADTFSNLSNIPFHSGKSLVSSIVSLSTGQLNHWKKGTRFLLYTLDRILTIKLRLFSWVFGDNTDGTWYR